MRLASQTLALVILVPFLLHILVTESLKDSHVSITQSILYLKSENQVFLLCINFKESRIVHLGKYSVGSSRQEPLFKKKRTRVSMTGKAIRSMTDAQVQCRRSSLVRN